MNDPILDVLDNIENKESEFGCGLVYCIGLFLKHANQMDGVITDDNMKAKLWFSGAKDHIYELKIPETFPFVLQEKIRHFKAFVFAKDRSISNTTTIKDIDEAILLAEEILRMIDLLVLNVESHGAVYR